MNEYITVAEASKRWGICETTVREACVSGRVVAFRVGSQWLIARDQPLPVKRDPWRPRKTALVGGAAPRQKPRARRISGHVPGPKLPRPKKK